MRKISGNTLIELLEFRITQEVTLKHYKLENNNEMVYVVYWSILEKVVKAISSEYRRQQLQVSLNEWQIYLKGETERPLKAPKTDLDSQRLPK